MHYTSVQLSIAAANVLAKVDVKAANTTHPQDLDVVWELAENF